jgi:hypothetical protein
VVFVSLLAWAATAQGAGHKAKKPRVMLLDIPADQAFSVNVTKAMNDFIAGAVTDQGFQVITQQDVTAALGVERQRQLLGCGETNCLAEIGGAMGADYIVRGNIAVLDADTALTLALVDNKGQPIKMERKLVSGKSSSTLIKALEELVPKLMRPIRPEPEPAALTATPGTAASTPTAGGLTASTAAPAEESSAAPYVFLGVGAAGLVGSAVFGGLSLAERSTYLRAFGTGQTSALAGDRSTTNMEAGVAWTALGVGVVAAAIGTFLWLHHDSPTPAGEAP